MEDGMRDSMDQLDQLVGALAGASHRVGSSGRETPRLAVAVAADSH
jgi:hypothetical protein